MKHKFHKLLLSFILLSVVLVSPSNAWACDQYQCDEKKDDENAYINCLSDKKSCLESKLTEVKTQKASLTNTISVIAGKINLQQLNISQTLAEILQLEKEIELLDDRIGTLNLSLEQLTEMLLERVRAKYKKQLITPVFAFTSSQSGNNHHIANKYVSQAGQQTAIIMHKAEIQRQLFDSQKQRKQEVQESLESKRLVLEQQRQELASQKAAQQKVLNETNNSEAEYQRQLSAVLSEYQAIQAIIAGGGAENKVGDVKTGDKIASVIIGRSCNSSNTHLHFMVTKNGTAVNPFSYLKSIDHTNCSGSSCGSSDGDGFNPSGDWSWPLDGPVRLSQGYGQTWAVRHTWVSRIYSFHNGIDFTGGSTSIKATADGELIRGSFTGGSCQLRYVKINHGDGLVSWYLHVNY